jgi:N-acetylglucosamine-6-phosphate deacetylase
MTLAGLVLRGGRLTAGEVALADGVVLAGPEGRDRRRLPAGWIVAPGLVDLQVNGFGGAEVGDEPDALATVARALPRAGVTAFCPTLISRSPAAYRRAAAALAATEWPADGARPLGVHLEGPFLARPGAHARSALRSPAPDEVARLLAAFSPAIVTLAPELPGALEAIARIARAGAVAAVGHTEADAETGRRAIRAGARLLSHALNAMRGIETRAPSALTAFLLDRRARVSLIADGVHVAPEVAAVLARVAARRLVLVSDASAAAGAPAGRYRLGGREIVSDGVSARIGRGLAGSAAGLDAGPRTLAAAGLPRGAALAAAAEAPRRLLRLPPGLAPGSPADLVVLDEALVPRLTLVGGRVAHADPGLPAALRGLEPPPAP